MPATIGPRYGINSVMPAQTPKMSAYLPPFGSNPERSRIQSPTPELVSELHLRASAWYEANGMLARAVDHRLEAGDEEGAVALIVRNWMPIYQDKEFGSLMGWVSRLDEDQSGRKSD